jgi:hypothetical protein
MDRLPDLPRPGRRNGRGHRVAGRCAHGEAHTAIACTNAKIGGQRKCIARGQYCARDYQRDYRRYGFSCFKRDARGRWHLV